MSPRNLSKTHIILKCFQNLKILEIANLEKRERRGPNILEIRLIVFEILNMGSQCLQKHAMDIWYFQLKELEQLKGIFI